MKIAYCGNFRVSYSTETHIAETLQEMGHEVTFLQEDEVNFDEVVPVAREHNLVMWTRTWSLDKDAQKRMLAGLRSEGITSVAVHLDRYWDLARERQIREEPWWGCDYVFSADGGNQERFQEAGVNHHWLRPAVYGPECVLGESRERFRSDVAFVGSYDTYHPEWPWRRGLIEFLKQTYGRKFRMWPQGKPIRGAGLSDLFASVKVVVGDSCFAGRAANYWSDRPYECVGRGGFLVFPRVDGLETDFKDGEHLVLYEAGDTAGLKSIVDRWLDDPEGREKIRLAGHEHVKSNHTYRHRMEEMLAVVERPTFCEGTDPSVVREILEDNVYRWPPASLPADPVVVDVGANAGVFSWLAASSGARVIAVEPAPWNLQMLRKNLFKLGIGERVTVAEVALGKPGAVEVVVGRKGAESRESWTRPGGSVKSISLDDLMAECGLDRIDFLKVDIEGDEYDLVAHASHKALAKVGRIAIEFHADPMVGRSLEGSLGKMLERLVEHFHLEVMGTASYGGMIYGEGHASPGS